MSAKLNWISFLGRLPGDPSDRAIAQAIGVSHSAVSRWRNGQLPKPKQAADVARAFGLHPVNGLVASGYLTLDDVDDLFEGNSVIEVSTVHDAPTDQLLQTLQDRFRLLEAGLDDCPSNEAA